MHMRTCVSQNPKNRAATGGSGVELRTMSGLPSWLVESILVGLELLSQAKASILALAPEANGCERPMHGAVKGRAPCISKHGALW